MRNPKTNIISGVGIAFALWAVWQIFKIVAFLAYFLMVPLLVITGLYLIGHYAPKGLHDDAQKAIRKGLDKISFNPDLRWAWGVTEKARTGLDWLGIHVKP